MTLMVSLVLLWIAFIFSCYLANKAVDEKQIWVDHPNKGLKLMPGDQSLY